MKQFSLYQPRDSFIHKLDPIDKILYVFAAVAVSFVIAAPNAILICLLFSGVILLIGRVLPKVIPLMIYSILVLLSVIIIQGLYMAENRTPLLIIGALVFYREGTGYALGLCLRVLNVLGAFAVLVLTTKPSDLIESLVHKGLSPRIGYILSSVLQMIPQMVASAERIMDAQRSRGMETEGGLGVRMKAFFPLIGPVIMNSLFDIKERALALEVRGFSHYGPKTFLKEQTHAAYETVIQWGLILIIIFAIIWRITLWLKLSLKI